MQSPIAIAQKAIIVVASIFVQFYSYIATFPS